MHGLGNDFVVIDGTRQKYNLTKENINFLADRHFGIGCDQVLLLEKAPEKDVDFFCHIFNADGTEIEQCGNGMRCIAKFAYENNLTDKKKLTLATFALKIKTQLEDDGNVTVNMGTPIIAENLPYKLATDLEIEMGIISVGNPHAIVLVDDVITAPVETMGPIIAKHPRFPNGINVNFAQIVNRNCIKLRVYERGAGETLACGSGACASVALGILRNLLDTTVEVQLPGGNLKVIWQDSLSPILLNGPAITVFHGETTVNQHSHQKTP